MLNFLYEDGHIICCVKPIGILSQSDEKNEENMVSLLKGAGNPYIGLIHRLDRNVGGVMVFAKTQTAAAKLSEAVRNREIIKEYLAVIHNRPQEDSGVLKDLLFKDSAKNKTYVVSRMRKGVREASLEYEVLDSRESEAGVITLVKARLHTGRTHQVRVQFASRKMPLVGDKKYGGRDNVTNPALWSYRLSFSHPVKNETVDVSCPPPDVVPWNEFSCI